MLSFILPTNVKVSYASGYIKLESSAGIYIKKAGNLIFNVLINHEGVRLFISGNSLQEVSGILSCLYQIVGGLSHGFQSRLRLVGIGFRATANELDVKSKANPIFIKTYRRNRFNSTNKICTKHLSLKIGYSHQAVYPLNIFKNSIITSSRLDGRTKGTLIAVKSTNWQELNQIIAEIRSFRVPDVYKGKGIYYTNEVVKLKKGKRQG